MLCTKTFRQAHTAIGMVSRASRLQRSEGYRKGNSYFEPGKQYARHVLDRFNTYDGCKARINSACQPGMLLRKREPRLCASEEEKVGFI